jgi:hypothetical protein
MVEQLSQAFERLGVPTMVLDTRAADCVASAVALVRQRRVRLFLSITGVGIPAPGQGAGFYGESDAPVLIYFLDDPASYYPLVRAPLPRLIVTFPTAHHVTFCRRFVRDDIAIHHLPHATLAADAAPWEGRDVPLFLSGSLMVDPEPFRAQWPRHGAEVAARLEAMIEVHDAEPTRPLHEIVLAALDGAVPPLEVLASYMITLDTYLRSRVKLQLAEALAHLPLTLCGEGWAHHAQPGQRAAFLPSRPTSETIATMRRTKIVLNPRPPYYQSHERPLQAMANGAVAAEGPNAAMARDFPDSYLALPAAPREAARVLEAALADEARLEAIAAAGHAACLAGHLWEHRAAEILKLTA